jgi:hypothetical protein
LAEATLTQIHKTVGATLLCPMLLDMGTWKWLSCSLAEATLTQIQKTIGATLLCPMLLNMGTWKW